MIACTVERGAEIINEQTCQEIYFFSDFSMSSIVLYFVKIINTVSPSSHFEKVDTHHIITHQYSWQSNTPQKVDCRGYGQAHLITRESVDPCSL